MNGNESFFEFPRSSNVMLIDHHFWDVEAYKKQLPEIEALQKKGGQ